MGFDVTTRLSKLKASAKARGYNINLDINKYQVLIDYGCHYCGNSLEHENGYCLDRVNPKKGYNIENLVGCCGLCNRIKSNLTYNEFLSWLSRAAKHIDKQQSYIKELEQIGITKEIYIKLEEAFYKELTIEAPKNRLKVVNTDNNDD